MTGEDFTAFLAHMGWNKSEASRVLGLGRNTVDRYLDGGAPAYIGYACAAIAFGLPKWESA